MTAATKQAPLVMHVSYEIRLPNHDFVKAIKHKLTPSVYAGCEIRSPSAWADPEISYSGPTYVAIRSGKHDSNTVYSHGKDFNHVMEMKEFQELMKVNDVTKPIAIILYDGGPVLLPHDTFGTHLDSQKNKISKLLESFWWKFGLNLSLINLLL